MPKPVRTMQKATQQRGIEMIRTLLAALLLLTIALHGLCTLLTMLLLPMRRATTRLS